mmetsp:Transcript_13628/g.13194  ORF Transcript_13628/g.13194 Transcript_13628/m.13194 type:complete len:135 (+) Transcript_13628:88-492(+)
MKPPDEVGDDSSQAETVNTSEIEFIEPSDSNSSIRTSTNQTSVNDADTILTPNDENINQTVQQTVWQGALWTGSKLLFGIEYIGEIVANVMGLNDSKYQDVIDQMDENDWRIAKENHARKEQEYQMRQAGGGVV